MTDASISGGHIPGTVKTLDDLQPLRLLVAVDGSPGSIIALQRASQLVRGVTAYEIKIIYVVEEGAGQERLVSEGDPAREALGKAILEQAVVYLRNEEVDASSELLRGNPANIILEYADGFHPNMLLVGSRGMGPIRGGGLGAVAEAVSKRSKWPVLVVRS